MEKYRIKEITVNKTKYYKLQKRILLFFWIDIKLPIYTIGEATLPKIDCHDPVKTLEHWKKEGFLNHLFQEYYEYWDRDKKQYRHKYLTIAPKTTNRKAIEELKDWFMGNMETYYPGLVRAGYIIQKKGSRTKFNDIGISYIASDTHELTSLIIPRINWELEMTTFLVDKDNGYKDLTDALEVAKRSSELHKDYERRAQNKKNEYYKRRNPEKSEYIS